MKRYLNQIIGLTGSVIVLFSSCIKEQSTVVYEGGTPPVLTSTATDSISLPASDTTATAVTFNWTNPNYNFSNGTNSLSVNYYLEVDTVGDNFAHAAQVGISSSLTQTFSVSQFNTILTNQLLVDTGVTLNLQIRIVSFLPPLTSSSPITAVLYSDTLNYTAIAYLPPPAVPQLPGALWITGDATGDGWMTAGTPATIAGQQMTEVTPTLWTITMPLIGGQQFLLVPANTWTNKYATNDGTGIETGSGGTFAYNAGNNFTGPTSSGTYTITFNFQTGLFTITQ
jgi:hypothetical protein